MVLISFELIISRTDSGKLFESQNNAIRESSNREIDGASFDDTSCGSSGKSDEEEGLSDIAKKKKGKKQKSKCNNKNRRRKRKRDDSPTNDKKRKRKRQKKEAVEVCYFLPSLIISKHAAVSVSYFLVSPSTSLTV